MRFRVEPRDVPPEVAARRLGLTAARFDEVRADLMARGFPAPDPSTGHFDLDAIDEWRKRRHPHLFHTPAGSGARDARNVVGERLARLTGGQR
jgi:hypothetical protein